MSFGRVPFARQSILEHFYSFNLQFLKVLIERNAGHIFSQIGWRWTSDGDVFPLESEQRKKEFYSNRSWSKLDQVNYITSFFYRIKFIEFFRQKCTSFSLFYDRYSYYSLEELDLRLKGLDEEERERVQVILHQKIGYIK